MMPTFKMPLHSCQMNDFVFILIFLPRCIFQLNSSSYLLRTVLECVNILLVLYFSIGYTYVYATSCIYDVKIMLCTDTPGDLLLFTKLILYVKLACIN